MVRQLPSLTIVIIQIDSLVCLLSILVIEVLLTSSSSSGSKHFFSYCLSTALLISLTNLIPAPTYFCRELPSLLFGVDTPLLPNTILLFSIPRYNNQYKLPFYNPIICYSLTLAQVGIIISQMNYSYLLKYIIIGDQSVGKSCLLMRFIDDQFKLDSDATIGVEFASKTIKLKSKVIKLQIWDTAGQQAYKSITRSYYRGTIGVLLVYDITSLASFESAGKWLEEARNFATNDNIEVLLVGNKSDMNSSRRVSFQQGVDFAKKNGAYFLESSAKDGLNANYAFELLTEKIVEKIEAGMIDTSDDNGGVKLGEYQPMAIEVKRSKCC